MKKYADYMDNISSDELYYRLIAYGLFTDKLPPVFESISFADFCKNKKNNFRSNYYDFIRYNTIRNNCIPRQLGIPVPMVYERLCGVLKDNWQEIRDHFHAYTDNLDYVISRLHIQLRSSCNELFEMNYDDWKNAGSPQDDLLIGNSYIVKTDISTCFPSIYTHSIPWALVGKGVAKNDRDDSVWYNKIDKECQNTKYGETHGLLIGPHASNLISEIILVVVDSRLYEKGWRFIRNIDDYTCYVESKSKAEEFVLDLSEELKEFDLVLNHKKTIIEELPHRIDSKWKRKLNSFNLLTSYNQVNYTQARAYFDLAIELSRSENNIAVIKYAIKVLSGQENFSNNAKQYCWKISMHLCLLYPYLISLMEEKIFLPFNVPIDAIDDFVNKAYKFGLANRNYEEYAYAIYFAIKYDIHIQDIDITYICSLDDCVLKILSYIYCQKNDDTDGKKKLQKNASDLYLNNNMDRNWLFVYEALKANDLKDDWKCFKKAKISFIKKEFRF